MEKRVEYSTEIERNYSIRAERTHGGSGRDDNSWWCDDADFSNQFPVGLWSSSFYVSFTVPDELTAQEQAEVGQRREQ